MTSGATISAALAQSGLVSLDAQVLLAHVMGQDRAWLVAHGRDAIARMLKQRPGDFVKVVASLVPRELLVGEASPLASLSDDELETLIGSVRALQAKSEEKARSQPAKPH